MNVMEFAVNLETEGEEFYRKQAKLNKDNQLYGMFTSLADDEHMHAEILKKRTTDFSDLPDSNLLDDIDVFSDEKQFKIEYKQSPDQLDYYREALKKEQESIDLYTKLMNENSENAKLFEYLIAQENKHYNLIYDLITLLERSESWVESPEFGVREDY